MTLVCHEAVVFSTSGDVYVTEVFVPEGPFEKERTLTVTRILTQLLPDDECFED